MATFVSLLPNAALLAADAPKTITPPDSLLVDGIPPISAEVIEQVGRYTEARAAAFVD